MRRTDYGLEGPLIRRRRTTIYFTDEESRMISDIAHSMGLVPGNRHYVASFVLRETIRRMHQITQLTGRVNTLNT